MSVQTWQSGACTVSFDNLYGAATVSGQGAMADYNFDKPWLDQCLNFQSLVIENGVTHIGSDAFGGGTSIRNPLTLPASVTSIGDGAFNSCTFTGSLTIPNTVTRIGSSAFLGCRGFTGTLTISSNVTELAYGAFKACTGLTGPLTIPNGVISISRGAFNSCGFTGPLTIPASVISIGEYAFAECKRIKTIFNFAKEQKVKPNAFDDMTEAITFYGYPENAEFKNVAGERWRDIRSSPSIVTLSNKVEGELYPRTKGEAVYLDSGRTLEAALGGLSFWRGTQAEYNALSPKLDKTVYCIIGGSVIVT